MFNTDMPTRAELPSTRQLLRSTFLAAASAVVLLVAVVLPAEYGLDPTGIGRALGLTEMGEIKARLNKEAAEDAAATQRSESPVQANASELAKTPEPLPAAKIDAAAPQSQGRLNSTPWRDEMKFTLKPGEGTEIKMRMREGDRALFAWAVQGGTVNFDTHGDGSGRSISYEKGRSVAADEGELVAAFTGGHGWFWRNRGAADVSVVLRTAGTYSDIQRLK
jgi:hypothetical protein